MRLHKESSLTEYYGAPCLRMHSYIGSLNRSNHNPTQKNKEILTEFILDMKESFKIISNKRSNKM